MNRKTTIAAFAAVALIAAGCSYSSDDGGDKNATDPAPADSAQAASQPAAAKPRGRSPPGT
jgi:hypothetical protein